MNFLPGWSPQGSTTGRASVTFSVVDSTTSTTEDITLPSGINAGDLIIIAGIAVETTTNTPDFNPPSGFTEIFEESGNPNGTEANRGIIYIKEAVGDEDTDVFNVWQVGESTFRGLFSLVLRPNRNFSNPTVVSSTFESTGGNPDAQTVGVATPYNLALALYGAENPVDPRTSSIAATAELAAGTRFFMKYFLFNPDTTAQQFTVDMDDEGNNQFLGAIALTVAAQ